MIGMFVKSVLLRRGGVCLLAVVGLLACGSDGSRPVPTSGSDGRGADASADWFVDQAARVGLDFIHFNGMSGKFYQPEIAAPGVGMFDYDNDGDLDVYLVQGEMLGDGVPTIPLPDGHLLGDRLYRNDLDVQSGDPDTLRFTDVTEESGLSAARGYGMGVSAGDYDNDGWLDLYLTRFGRNQMFRNRGDGTFVEVSVETGTDHPAWAIPASFFDYDRDGWLDLFVGNYMSYTLETHSPCYFRAGPLDYCPPEVSPAEPNLLYRNNGDGTFSDATEAAGLGGEFGPALGTATADYNNDGWLDLFVANDQQENQLWINQQDGTFRNMALLWGTALGAAGEAKADMGVDAGDFDNDGDEDLFVTELTGQGSTLYVNDGTGLFEDQSARLGVRGPSLPHTGFGAGWLDFDNDGWLDMIAVNGFVTQRLDVMGSDEPFSMDAQNQLFRNLEGAGFDDVTDRAGQVFELSEVSRGAALGDIDNDGDVDVLIGNDAGPVRLLINHLGNENHWLGLRVVSADGEREVVGSRVEVVLAGSLSLWRHARADGSYASANDSRILVGLGSVTDVERVRVTWPDGQIEDWADLTVDRYHTLVKGSGHRYGS